MDEQEKKKNWIMKGGREEKEEIEGRLAALYDLSQ